MIYDVIVVGGSYAGMSAAMQLARARCAVLVIDAAQRRNRFAAASHGFLGQDGFNPDATAEQARQQLLAYPTVTWHEAAAVKAEKDLGVITVTTSDGDAFSARRLILASGVTDELPDIPGLAERWGRQVFHCPYCHGYELDRGAIGVLASSPLAMHQALMLPDWGPTTLFLNGAFQPDADQSEELARRGVSLEQDRILSIGGEQLDVTLASGRVLSMAGLFVQSRTHLTNPLIKQLGLAVESRPLGDFLTVNHTGETSVAGVFACGDVAVAAGNVAVAVGDGARTGSAVHQSLIFAE
ncbi:NAD(P)/FAD-dependent oxidoreductase [Pseudomonas psychrotolerans]|uniref:NAD(P)/FAD-dependent oxidoreductase n=1 Tax=Pseudomonas oryzihabitans TaxID=47885 RepID=UPI0015E42440|nr:NAD(P)/FAD-dependent oxidoreductase [Pseudomonas psychrotolerans]MBA1180054.1 NAD(P)/FAD-dependent oxidoreductase [Pseudomonas psychrotolerans]MBA1211169.1 NAD(P)/FAD-dependent oxidoreductase [Pseudomonas psychrotolerans]